MVYLSKPYQGCSPQILPGSFSNTWFMVPFIKLMAKILLIKIHQKSKKIFPLPIFDRFCFYNHLKISFTDVFSWGKEKQIYT